MYLWHSKDIHKQNWKTIPEDERYAEILFSSCNIFVLSGEGLPFFFDPYVFLYLKVNSASKNNQSH